MSGRPKQRNGLKFKNSTNRHMLNSSNLHGERAAQLQGQPALAGNDRQRQKRNKPTQSMHANLGNQQLQACFVDSSGYASFQTNQIGSIGKRNNAKQVTQKPQNSMEHQVGATKIFILPNAEMAATQQRAKGIAKSQDKGVANKSTLLARQAAAHQNHTPQGNGPPQAFVMFTNNQLTSLQDKTPRLLPFQASQVDSSQPSSLQQYCLSHNQGPKGLGFRQPYDDSDEEEEEESGDKKAAELIKNLISMPLSQSLKRSQHKKVRTDTHSKVPSKLKFNDQASLNAFKDRLTLNKAQRNQKTTKNQTAQVQPNKTPKPYHSTQKTSARQVSTAFQSTLNNQLSSSRPQQRQIKTQAPPSEEFASVLSREVDFPRRFPVLPQSQQQAMRPHKHYPNPNPVSNGAYQTNTNSLKISVESREAMFKESARSKLINSPKHGSSAEHSSIRKIKAISSGATMQLPEILQSTSQDKMLTLNEVKKRQTRNSTHMFQQENHSQLRQSSLSKQSLAGKSGHLGSNNCLLANSRGGGSRNAAKDTSVYGSNDIDPISSLNKRVAGSMTNTYFTTVRQQEQGMVQVEGGLSARQTVPLDLSQLTGLQKKDSSLNQEVVFLKLVPVTQKTTMKHKKEMSLEQKKGSLHGSVSPDLGTLSNRRKGADAKNPTIAAINKTKTVPKARERKAKGKQEPTDSDMERDDEEQIMRQLGEQIKVAAAHAELLDFFAQCSDHEKEEKSKQQQQQLSSDPASVQRRNTHEYLRRNKLDNDIQRLSDLNGQGRRMAYAQHHPSGSGPSTSFLERVNSYKLLTHAIGRDENGEEVGPSLNEFRIQRVLGTGASAVVKLATHELTKKRVALKVYSQVDKLEAVKRKAIWQEIQCMRILKSEFFPKIYTDFEVPDQNLLVLVQEYVSGQSLFQLVKAKGQKSGLSEETARFYFKQIVDAVRYMHSNLICHRDLKLENILVSDRKRVKIIDFGFSIRTPEDVNLKIFCGTSSYMSPEIVRKSEYSGFKADIWALGIVLYVLLTGRFPFKAKTEKELFTRIQMGQFLPPVQMGFDAKRLVTRMLSVEPEKRPSASEILRDPWLTTNANTVGVPIANII